MCLRVLSSGFGRRQRFRCKATRRSIGRGRAKVANRQHVCYQELPFKSFNLRSRKCQAFRVVKKQRRCLLFGINDAYIKQNHNCLYHRHLRGEKSYGNIVYSRTLWFFVASQGVYVAICKHKPK